MASAAGVIYSVDDLDLEPKPAQPIPIWLGALGPRGLALSGRLADGWIPFLRFAGPDRIPELLDRIRTASVAAGRPADAVRAVYSVPVRLDPKARTTAGVIAGSAADITEQLHRFTELGFTGFAPGPTTGQPLAGLGAGEHVVAVDPGRATPPCPAREPARLGSPPPRAALRAGRIYGPGGLVDDLSAALVAADTLLTPFKRPSGPRLRPAAHGGSEP